MQQFSLYLCYYGSNKDKFCRHTAVWDKEGEWDWGNKAWIKVNKAAATGSSKQLGGRQRRSSIAGDKYSEKYSVNIWQITKIFGGLPWYLADYHDIRPQPAHCTYQFGTVGMNTAARLLWLLHFVSVKPGNICLPWIIFFLYCHNRFFSLGLKFSQRVHLLYW